MKKHLQELTNNRFHVAVSIILKNHATMLHHIKQHESMTKYEKTYCDRYNEFLDHIKCETQIYNYE